MRRVLDLILVGLAAVSAPALRADEAYDPYQIPREQFRARVSRIVLRPLWIPPDAPQREALRGGFEQRIGAELTRRGYAVVPSSEFRDTWSRFATDLGGVYDPVKREPDEAKYKLVWAHTLRELERRLDVDAVLVAGVQSGFMYTWMDNPFISERWMAAFQLLQWQGKPLRGMPGRPQRVDGHYLVVKIFDRAEVELYNVKVPLQWSHVFAGRGYEEIPPAQLYRDEERNRKSVESALESLETRGAAATAEPEK